MKPLNDISYAKKLHGLCTSKDPEYESILNDKEINPCGYACTMSIAKGTAGDCPFKTYSTPLYFKSCKDITIEDWTNYLNELVESGMK